MVLETLSLDCTCTDGCNPLERYQPCIYKWQDLSYIVIPLVMLHPGRSTLYSPKSSANCLANSGRRHIKLLSISSLIQFNSKSSILAARSRQQIHIYRLILFDNVLLFAPLPQVKTFNIGPNVEQWTK